MADNYAAFLKSKRAVAHVRGIDNPPVINSALFPFQRDVVRWALRRGRAALFEECGLGKSWQALEWSRIVSAHTGAPVLIVTPLAVAQQFKREGAKFGVEVRVCREREDLGSGVNVTNYERIERFDVSGLGGVVLDESSILKSFNGKTRTWLIDSLAHIPFRLACTATPAPNDHTELGNHAEFLGVMNRTEMLATYFVHDGGETQVWRLKGHAEDEFWRWVCSWAVCLARPSDLGYDDAGYELPELRIQQHVINMDSQMARAAGVLFGFEAKTLPEQRAARKASLAARVEACAALVNGSTEQWLVWCDLNDESAALAKAIPGSVEVSGSDSAEHKESTIERFTSGDIRVIVSKPSIYGWGVNLQNCARAAFVGLSHSFEQWHQANRRIWRFGQRREVECHVITSSAEGAVVANIQRKQADAERMVRGMVAQMSDVSRAELRAATRQVTNYEPKVTMKIPAWVGREAS